MVQTQFKTKLKVIWSDNGSKFTPGAMKQFYVVKGIMHKTSCINTPQQNEGLKESIAMS